MLIMHGGKGKCKAIPLQAWRSPKGSSRLRLPDFKTVGTWGGKVVSPTHRPSLPPRKYSLMLEAGSTPGPQRGRNDYVNGKFQHHRELNPRPSGLQRSASTDCATACPHWAWWHKNKPSALLWNSFDGEQQMYVITAELYKMFYQLWTLL